MIKVSCEVLDNSSIFVPLSSFNTTLSRPRGPVEDARDHASSHSFLAISDETTLLLAPVTPCPVGIGLLCYGGLGRCYCHQIKLQSPRYDVRVSRYTAQYLISRQRRSHSRPILYQSMDSGEKCPTFCGRLCEPGRDSALSSQWPEPRGPCRKHRHGKLAEG
jgi:hypothetical protein